MRAGRGPPDLAALRAGLDVAEAASLRVGLGASEAASLRAGYSMPPGLVASQTSADHLFASGLLRGLGGPGDVHGGLLGQGKLVAPVVWI